MANRSLHEVKSQLYISMDMKRISNDELDKILLNAAKLENRIKGFVRKMKASEYTDAKFKQIHQVYQ